VCAWQPLACRLCVDILLQAADGLSYLHSLGVIHRDVRGDNVLIASKDPLRVVLSDFGLAHRQDGASLGLGSGVSLTKTTMGPYGVCCNELLVLYLRLNHVCACRAQRGDPQRRLCLR
jgi:serine/threonine protein kinase